MCFRNSGCFRKCFREIVRHLGFVCLSLVWVMTSFARFDSQRTKRELIKILCWLFIALFDVFLSVNITFSYAGKNLFLINTQHMEGCTSVIIKRSISVTDPQHLKWSGLGFFNRDRCTAHFVRRFNHTRTTPVTSLQSRYPSACLNDLLET